MRKITNGFVTHIVKHMGKKLMFNIRETYVNKCFKTFVKQTGCFFYTLTYVGLHVRVFNICLTYEKHILHIYKS